MRKSTYTVYNKSQSKGVTGVEITEGTTDPKKKDEKGMAGRVGLRFFATDKKVYYSMEPHEAFKLGFCIEQHARLAAEGKAGKKQFPPHVYRDVKTNVTVEAWSRGDKGGTSLLCAQGDKFFNIALDGLDGALFVAELLKKYALNATWTEGTYEQRPPMEDTEGADDQEDQLAARLKELAEAVKKHGIVKEKFLAAFRAQSLESFPSDKIDEALAMIEQKYGGQKKAA